MNNLNRSGVNNTKSTIDSSENENEGGVELERLVFVVDGKVELKLEEYLETVESRMDFVVEVMNWD